MQYRRLAAVALLCCNVLNLSVLGASSLEESISPDKGELEWRFKGNRVFLCRFATNQFKPYVRELFTLQGDNVLRDSPPDHLHHHGLMYAVQINGVNFWEEKTDPGIEKNIKILTHGVTRHNDGRDQATCSWLIHWLPPGVKDSADSALLIERRTLALTVDESAREVALQWNAAFEVGRGAQKVNLHGTDYNGLGMRLPQSFDRVAQFENSENAPYPGLKNEPTRNITNAKWSAVSGKIENREIMVVIFGSPDNRAGNHFFSLLEPFAYSGVTQALDQQSIDYARGDKFELCFLITIYSAKQSPEFLNRRYAIWRGLNAAK